MDIPFEYPEEKKKNLWDKIIEKIGDKKPNEPIRTEDKVSGSEHEVGQQENSKSS